MGITQRSLGLMAGGVSPLRTPFIAALIALCLIRSILSLDMSKVKSSVEPVYSGVVNSMKQAAEDEAIRMALGLSPDNSGSSNSDQKKENQEVKEETSKGKEESATISDSASTKTDQELVGVPQKTSKNITISPLPLVLYAYSESETARPNLEFFIRHALNEAADFIFILNGETDAAAIIPNLPNIRVVQRDNGCYDLGSYAEVLQRDHLWKGYKKFIMLNANLR
ncbi:hypothetical protein BGZ57DRAFT_920965 [Hyaloscypha finlandica]|nr:hypothetical protein BGZ57DRAFT_920965 [Hyaloscypha finlandica]